MSAGNFPIAPHIVIGDQAPVMEIVIFRADNIAAGGLTNAIDQPLAIIATGR